MEHSEQPIEIPPISAHSIELIDPRFADPTEPPPPPVPQFRSRKRLTLLLFVATCVSMFWAGMAHTPQYERTVENLLRNGAYFSGALILILLAHEMGHYLQARRYGVPATLPYFIPMPFSPFGTMGAVIVQGAGVADRKSLFDIAVTGPLAGIVLAIPVAYLGLHRAVPQVVPEPGEVVFIMPLLMRWMMELARPDLVDSAFGIANEPFLMAGWVGIFITALNLIPIGQLDGGHILYTLIGKRAHTVAIMLLVLAVGYMVYSEYYAYGLMVVLLLMMGPRHPPTADDTVPLGIGRKIVGWLSIAFVVIGLTPMPLIITQPKPLPPPASGNTLTVETEPRLQSGSITTLSGNWMIR